MADALGLTISELEELEQVKEDQREAESRGVEVWEWLMMKSGATKEQIAAKQKLLKESEAEALGMSLEDLEEMERNRAELREAQYSGVEVWELRMVKSGASSSEIETERERQRQEMERFLEG